MLRRFAIVLAFSIAPALFAQTTGSLSGKITDNNGGPLPGVTVEVKSPALQVSRLALSDPLGVYRFPVLPPGASTATFQMHQWSTGERHNVQVSLRKRNALDDDI